jgi:hypothetical protein
VGMDASWRHQPHQMSRTSAFFQLVNEVPERRHTGETPFGDRQINPRQIL